MRGLGALRMAAGLDHDHRLGARRGARRRHELARVLDRFDVEQDRSGARGRARNNRAGRRNRRRAGRRSRRWRKSRRRAPRAHSTMPAAMAPDCEMSARSPAAGHAGGEAGIELGARRHDAEAVRPDQAHAVLPRAAFSQASAIEPGPWPRPAVMMIAAGTPLAAASAMIAGTAAGRHGDNDDVGHFRQVADRLDRAIRRRSRRIRGLTTWIVPAKPPSRRFFSTARPSEPSRGLVPTTATERGAKSFSRR